MATDRSLIKYELNVLKQMNVRKEIYIVSAAHKLESNYIDKSQIGAALTALLTGGNYRISKSYIMSSLPDAYKRTYTKRKHPRDIFEEVLMKADETFSEIKITNRQLLKIYRSKKSSEQAAILAQFESIIHESHGKFGTVYKGILQEMASIQSVYTLVDSLEGMREDARVLRRMTDPRIKLRRWLKIRLKAAYLSHTTGHIASVLGISHTWAKNIRHTPAYDAFMAELQSCPQCGYNLLAYIDKADEAFNAGKPIPEPITLPKKGLPYTKQ